MRKLLFVAIMLFILLGSLPVKGASPVEKGSSFQVIPDEAIRLRILANSDSATDQALKRKIRDAVNADITKWVEDIANIEEARKVIRENLPEIKGNVANVLQQEGSDQTYEVKYGEDVNFPAKVYGSYVYPAGSYEAILITLGKGKGANWWCVLFPPLCFLDFSNGTSVAEEKNTEEVQVAKAEDEDKTKAKEKEEDKEPVKIKSFFFGLFS